MRTYGRSAAWRLSGKICCPKFICTDYSGRFGRRIPALHPYYWSADGFHGHLDERNFRTNLKIFWVNYRTDLPRQYLIKGPQSQAGTCKYPVCGKDQGVQTNINDIGPEDLNRLPSKSVRLR